MAALMEVRPMKARGAWRTRPATPSASAALPTGVHSTTTACSVLEAHSTKQSAMRPFGPPGHGPHDARVGDGGGIALALQPELLLVDAARDVGRQHQQQIDLIVLGVCGLLERAKARRRSEGDRDRRQPSQHERVSGTHSARQATAHDRREGGIRSSPMPLFVGHGRRRPADAAAISLGRPACRTSIRLRT